MPDTKTPYLGFNCSSQFPETCFSHFYQESSTPVSSRMTGLSINLETIPYSKRTHLILMPRVLEKIFGNPHFESYKETTQILPPTHPMSARVKFIAQKLITALEKDLRKQTVWENLSFPSSWLHAFMSLIWSKEQLADLRATRYLKNIDWNVVVVDRPSFYAYSSPGGKIVIHSGTLECLRSEGEIAFVIGHEIAHVLARHGAERLTKNMGLANLALFAYNFDASVMSKGLPNLHGNSSLAKELELEADYIGLLLISSAGYHPRSALKMMEVALQKYGNQLSSKSRYPYNEKRFEMIAKAQDEAMIFYEESTASSS